MDAPLRPLSAEPCGKPDDAAGNRPEERRRSLLRTLLFSATPTLLLAGIFLLGFIGEPENSIWLNRSPIWGPGDPFFKDADERFVSDPGLIWRGRPNHHGTSEYEYGGALNEFRHNALGMRDDEIAARKKPGVIRVLNAGDSATWGLNLKDRSETYSDQLEALLCGRSGGSYEIINCGVIGYSSLQGVRFLQQRLDELKPDVVTVFLGNNDSQASGAKDLERSPHEPSALASWLSGNFFYLLARKGVLAVTEMDFERRTAEFMQKVSGRGGGELDCPKEDYYRNLARVTPKQYGENLREMAALCRERNVRLILLKVPMNLIWPLITRPTLETAFLPNGYWRLTYVPQGYLARAQAVLAPPPNAFAGHPYLCMPPASHAAEQLKRLGLKPRALVKSMSGAANDSSGPSAVRVLAMHNLSVWRILQADLAGAAALLEHAIALCEAPDGGLSRVTRAQLLYTLGIDLFLQGRKDDALRAFRAAREAVPFAFCPDYEVEFDRAVGELGIEWIDLPALFAGADPSFGGSALMHDWVHPNAAGNRVIAEALAEKLSADSD